MRHILLILLFPLVCFAYTVDVVIPCAEKDLQVIDLCIDSIKDHIEGVGKIFVISERPFEGDAEWIDEALFPFTVDLVGAELRVGKHERCGWYFQQLLKLYAPFVIEGISDNVLVVDADLIFLKTFTPVDETGRGVIRTHPLRNYQTYLDHAMYLHQSLFLGARFENPVVHHMLFQKAKLATLFDCVENKHHLEFWKVFLRLVPDFSPKQNPSQFQIGASEYTIYATFVQAVFPNDIEVRRIQMYEMERLDELPRARLGPYDVATYHHYRRTDANL